MFGSGRSRVLAGRFPVDALSFLFSNGDFHFGMEKDHSVPYLKSLMHFMGIEIFQSIVIEGVDALPHMAAELMRQGSDACRTAGATF